MKKTLIKILIFSLLGIIAFCLVTIAFEIFSINDLPISFIGACLGAIISAIITLVLLNGQTEQEEIKECNVRVFEKNQKYFRNILKLYQKYWTNKKYL